MFANPWLALVFGFVLLLVGAELLVRGASALAARLGVPALVIGLTIVAYGTSAPELAVSLRAALDGKADLALGNVLGSNICNLLLILGVSALLAPLAVDRKVIRVDVPLMIAASLGLVPLAMDGRVGRVEGAVLVILGLAYTVYQIRGGRRAEAVPESEEGAPQRSEGRAIWLDPVRMLLGLALLTVGADRLVNGASTLARAFGLSELVIGLTVVAVGTSLPELATSAVAALRGERDLAVGNLVGSNVFNIVWVLGLSATIAPNGVAVVPSAWAFDLPVMILVALLALPIAVSGSRVGRGEGALFVGLYAMYLTVLVHAARAATAEDGWQQIFLGILAAAVLAAALGHFTPRWYGRRS